MEPGGHRLVQRGDAPTIAASDRQTSTGAPVGTMRESTRKTIATIQAGDRRQEEDPVRIGRIQHLLAGLQDIVDITPHTPALN